MPARRRSKTLKYPDLRGQWTRAAAPGTVDEPRFDPAKPPGRGQQPPLTPEYQAIFEANLREREAGVPGTWPGPTCLPPGMPAQMTAYRPLEFIVFPDVTYVRIDYIRDTRRRIYTDGRDWPKEVEDGFDGYSIGKWIDEDKDGKYDVLEVETRHFKGPRNFDLSGIPLHEDNETVIKERIFLDKADQNLLHDEITVLDHALTRPWTVMKSYRRAADLEAAMGRVHVRLGKQDGPHRRRNLPGGQGWLPQAGQEGPDATELEILPVTEVIASRGDLRACPSPGMNHQLFAEEFQGGHTCFTAA